MEDAVCFAAQTADVVVELLERIEHDRSRAEQEQSYDSHCYLHDRCLLKILIEIGPWLCVQRSKHARGLVQGRWAQVVMDASCDPSRMRSTLSGASSCL